MIQATTQAEAGNASAPEMLVAVAHDIRTPLNSVVGYLDLVLLGIGGPLTEIQRQYLSHAQEGCARVTQLIQHVLVYAAHGDAPEELDLRTVSLRRTLNSLVTMLQLDAEHKGVHLDLTGTNDDVIIRTDEDQLMRVVTNLLSNALKFTPVGGKVVVRYRARRGSVRILVWDNGPDIPPAAREKIFKPFVRLNDSEDGFGLGLAIARASARGLGGDLSVRSPGGRGAVFILRLPWTQDNAQTQPALTP